MRVPILLWPLIAALACSGGSTPTGGGGAGGGNPPPPPPPPPPSGGGVSVTMSEYAFSPPSLSITVGSTVTWTNMGTLAHTATSDAADSLSWDSGPVGAPGTDPYGGATPGGSFSLKFVKAGTYGYHCTYHGVTHGMTGTITVTP